MAGSSSSSRSSSSRSSSSSSRSSSSSNRSSSSSSSTLASQPVTNATSLTATVTGDHTVDLTWVRGSGAACCVWIKVGTSGVSTATDGTSFTANTFYGLGTSYTNGGVGPWYCVYNGTGTAVSVTGGLAGGTGYTAIVEEYNGTAGTGNENYTAGTTVNQQRRAFTTTGSSSSSSKSSSSSSTSSSSSSSRSSSSSSRRSSSSSSRRSSSSSSRRSSSSSSTLAIEPANQAHDIIFTNKTGVSVTATWTNPDIVFGVDNGTVIAFIGPVSTGDVNPIDGSTYTANTVFGSGSPEEDGVNPEFWFCVYKGTGNTVNITGLTPSTAYRVMVLAYNGTAGKENYNLNTATGNPANFTTGSSSSSSRSSSSRSSSSSSKSSSSSSSSSKSSSSSSSSSSRSSSSSSKSSSSSSKSSSSSSKSSSSSRSSRSSSSASAHSCNFYLALEGTSESVNGYEVPYLSHDPNSAWSPCIWYEYQWLILQAAKR